ncbi:MAG: hypothetical protein RRB13_04340 [bacterium]|nr:hypothetical protein [bacterium]
MLKAVTKERVEQLYRAQDKIKECVALIQRAVEGTSIEERVQRRLIARLMSYVNEPQTDCASIQELIREIEEER